MSDEDVSKDQKEIFMHHFMILESTLKGLSESLGVRMDEVLVEPDIIEGKECFPEGYVTHIVELHSNAIQAVMKSKELKHSLMACNNALLSLEKVKNG